MRYDRDFWILKDDKCTLADMEYDWHMSGGSTVGEENYQYYEMFHCEQYTDTGCDYERNGCQIREGDTVVDVGGNMGIFARSAWERGAERVFSFEPQRRVFECYNMNAKPGMECYNVGIADKMGKFELTYGDSDNNTGGGSLFADYENRGKEIFHRENVITLTLDQLFEIGLFNTVDFLKIDCEGAEGRVLKGITNENLRKFRCIAIEVHRSVIGDIEREEIVKRITALGYLHFAMFYGNDLVIYNFWKE